MKDEDKYDGDDEVVRDEDNYREREEEDQGRLEEDEDGEEENEQGDERKDKSQRWWWLKAPLVVVVVVVSVEICMPHEYVPSVDRNDHQKQDKPILGGKKDETWRRGLMMMVMVMTMELLSVDSRVLPMIDFVDLSMYRYSIHR